LKHARNNYGGGNNKQHKIAQHVGGEHA
jgi:hypothetical protein